MAVNIIGAGLAGLSAALTLARRGIKCRLISAQSSERAQSVLAEGGINAALDTMGQGDTVQLHFEETMNGGCMLADPDAVRGLTLNAPETVMMLASLGVPFNRNSDGSLALRSFGGQKKKRTAFAQSSTGKMIMTALIDAVRKHEASGLVTRYPHHAFVRVLAENGDCTGVRVRDSFTGKLYDMSGDVIMACGGLCGLFPGRTTGTVTNTGTAAAVLFAQGVKFADLEMIQYHPTTFAIPGKRCLISEAARGEGGRLYCMKNGERYYFMEEKYPVMKNLMPRDVVSREMFLASRDYGEIFLDMTEIPDDVWRNRLSDLQNEVFSYTSFDPAQEPVPVQPGIHYFMGGICVNTGHETSMKGLYAAGECACIYHGANRLGGNSMLGAVYGGKTAAENAADNDMTGEIKEPDGDEQYDCAVRTGFSERTGDILYGGLGIVRNEKDLQKSLDELDGLDCTNAAEAAVKQLAQAMLLSALERKESRGAHYREDFPETREEYRKTTAAENSGGNVRITFEAISGGAGYDSNI